MDRTSCSTFGLFAVTFILVLGTTASAQDPFFSLPPTSQGTQFDQLMRENENQFAFRLMQFMGRHELYALEDFEPGYFTYHVGQQSELFKLNYNHLFSRMVILTDTDTVFLNTDKLLKEVHLMSARFRYHIKWGFIQVINEGTVELGMRKELKIRKRTKLAPNEKPQLIDTPEFFSVIYDPASDLLPREEVALWRKVDYFLIDENSYVYLANQRGFNKVFPNKKAQIEARIRQRYREHNRIKFNDKEDVLELFLFCLEK